MIRAWRILIGSAIAIALTACVSPTKEPAANTPSQKTAPEKPIAKKVRGKVSSITLEEFFALEQSGNAIIYDARPSFVYAFGHVPNAINMPKKNCDVLITAWAPKIKTAIANGKSIVVYCTNENCPDARSVANHLSDFGYSSKVFLGGWNAWKEAGMPVE